MDGLELGWMPAAHRGFLLRAVPRLAENPLVVGVAAGGSFIDRQMDEQSDLDLVVATTDEALTQDPDRRMEIARGLGNLLAAFTGEHVGEPRLLIALYGDPLLHVDLKFVLPDALLRRVEDPVVLFERGPAISHALRTSPAVYPQPDGQWIEDRFWVWIHYAAGKLRRGELYEAKATLDFLVVVALGPLALREAGARASGVRRIEAAAPERAAELGRLCVAYERETVKSGLREAIRIYRELRSGVVERQEAERASVDDLEKA